MQQVIQQVIQQNKLEIDKLIKASSELLRIAVPMKEWHEPMEVAYSNDCGNMLIIQLHNDTIQSKDVKPDELVSYQMEVKRLLKNTIEGYFLACWKVLDEDLSLSKIKLVMETIKRIEV